MRTRNVVAALALTGGVAAAQAADLRVESPERRVAVLELFTSEGCSSCPPADRWLGDLRDDPRLWTRIVPVAFHVDYWNYLGWPDRFASPAFSERQREYVRRGHVSQVYTPGLVLAGAEWRGWFRHPVLRIPSGERVGRLVLEIDGSRALVAFTPKQAPEGALETHVVLLGLGLETEVRAGENRGRRLRHDFVVLARARVAMHRAGDEWHAATALPEADVEPPHAAIAAWVARPGDPPPIQAVGAFLPRAAR